MPTAQWGQFLEKVINIKTYGGWVFCICIRAICNKKENSHGEFYSAHQWQPQLKPD